MVWEIARGWEHGIMHSIVSYPADYVCRRLEFSALSQSPLPSFLSFSQQEGGPGKTAS